MLLRWRILIESVTSSSGWRVEPQRVHRERGQHRRNQVDDQGDDEQLLAPEPVRQVAEEQRPQARPEMVPVCTSLTHPPPGRCACPAL
jgi:hypothetical protein